MVSSSSENMLIGELDEATLLRRILSQLEPMSQGAYKKNDDSDSVGPASAVFDGDVLRCNSNAPIKTIIGPGDDAALLHCEGKYAFVSTDTIVENYDFRRLWPCGYRTTGYDLGWKTMVQNIADISAMGGLAAAITIALSLPRDLEVSWLEGFAGGVREAAGWFFDRTGASIQVIGGDLGAADYISATATVLGAPGPRGTRAREGTAPGIRRDGAQEGDIIAVSQGDFLLGSAHVALEYLETRGRMPEMPLLQPQLRPAPDFSAVFGAIDANSMIDTSDGLIHEVRTLVENSAQRRGAALQAQLDDDALTAMAEELEREMRCDFDTALTAVLSGGEDHLLVASFAADTDVPESFVPFGVIVRPTENKLAVPSVASKYLPRAVVFDHFHGRS